MQTHHVRIEVRWLRIEMLAAISFYVNYNNKNVVSLEFFTLLLLCCICILFDHAQYSLLLENLPAREIVIAGVCSAHFQ